MEKASVCLVSNKAQETFYNAINWNTLYENIEDYIGYYVEALNTNEAFAADLQKAYKWGPVGPKSGPGSRYGTLGFVVVKGDNFRQCQDIVVKITLTNRKGVGRTQPLAHIALHSERPVYYRDSIRSRSGCGYFISDKSSTRNYDEAVGPFHYKIDTLYWRDKEFTDSEKNIPFTSFQVDSRRPAFFEETVTDFRPMIDHHEIVVGGQKKVLDMKVGLQLRAKATENAKAELGESAEKKLVKKRSDQLLEKYSTNALRAAPPLPEDEYEKGSLVTDRKEQIELLNKIHQFMAFSFLSFWNTQMLVGKVEPNNLNETVFPGFPPIVRNGVSASSRGVKPINTKLKDKGIVTDLYLLGAKQPIYTGFFITNELSQKLLAILEELVPESFQNQQSYVTQAGHITMAFGESTIDVYKTILETISSRTISLQVTHVVVGKIDGKPIVVLKIALPTALKALCQNEVPHMTMYHHPDLKPIQSNELLQDPIPANVTEKSELKLEMEINAVLGIFVGTRRGGATRKHRKSSKKTRRLVAHKHK